MVVPLLLLLASLLGVAVALTLPALSDVLLLAGPCAVASAILLLRAILRRATAAKPAAPELIIVDGSNVLHWKDSAPRIGTVREVVDRLSRLGFAPGVVFDANVGYLIAGRYQHDGALSKLLGLPTDRVMVVDKGTPADAVILAAARDYGARIVSNDRYRDWADRHPEVGEPGHVVRGEYRGQDLWLDLGENREDRPFASQ